jgi:hypothetical protein
MHKGKPISTQQQRFMKRQPKKMKTITTKESADFLPSGATLLAFMSEILLHLLDFPRRSLIR